MTDAKTKCPKCGKPAESISFYERWGKDELGSPIKAKMYVHKSRITTAVIPMRMVDESCMILETDPEWE